MTVIFPLGEPRRETLVSSREALVSGPWTVTQRAHLPTAVPGPTRGLLE